MKTCKQNTNLLRRNFYCIKAGIGPNDLFALVKSENPPKVFIFKLNYCKNWHLTASTR